MGAFSLRRNWARRIYAGYRAGSMNGEADISMAPPVGHSSSLGRVLRCSLAWLVALLALTTVSNATAKSAPARVIAVKLFKLADGGSEVMIRVDKVPQYTARVAQNGKRIVVDLRGAVVSGAEPALTELKGVVGGVLTQGFRSQGVNTTRVLIQLQQSASYRIQTSSRGLHVLLQPAAVTSADGAKSGAVKPALSASAADAAKKHRVQVRNVKFRHAKTTDRIILELSGDVSHTQSSRGDDRTVFELRGAHLPKSLQRKLDVGGFGGGVHAISSYESNGSVMIDVDHRVGVSAIAKRYGSALHLLFSMGRVSSTLSGVGPDGKAARQVKSVASEADLMPNAEWSSEPDVAGAFLPGAQPMQQARRFTGRRVDLDLKDADIHDVFRTLAKVGRVNIVAADNVSGSVTISMNNVPWDQALDVILQAKGLGQVRRGNIVRIAQMADLNKERELALERRKSELQLAPIETRLIPVSYAKASDLQNRAKEMLSPRGSISVDERTNVLIARDVSGNLNQIEELTRALDTQTPQVLIEARIVEATSRFQRDVGIQWGGDLSFGPATGNETGLAFPSSIGAVGGASDQNTPTAGLSPTQNAIPNPNFAVNLPATVGTGAGGALGLTFGSIDNSGNLNVRLSAAEATGMLRIVSSPRILTLDNAEARITQGTLIPFSQISAQGVQTVFQEAKLQLLVTPHVTADGSISMHVKINRDEPDFNQTSARGDPTILKREAETELLVRDGHTAVIGGIYTRNTGRNLDQIPILGDIPVLGVLFQRRRSSDSRSELVIFLTPRIVNRAESLGR
jgi:type IV pilus assembly protein PilQ